MDNIYLEIHFAKKLMELLLEIEGIIKILEVNEAIKDKMMDDINDCKEIIREAKLNDTK